MATRIEREKEILQILDDEDYKLNKAVDNERTDRNLRLGSFRDNTKDSLKKHQKYIEEFQKNTMDMFYKLREELEAEMEDRFDAQDEIVDNLSNSIKTFQDTLKKIGQTL